MFDPAAVIRDVQQNQYPKDWRVVRGMRRLGYTLARSLLLLITGLFAILMPVIAFIVLSPGQSGSLLINLLLWGVALLPGGLIVWGIVRAISDTLADDRSLLVFLPDGVVECRHGKADAITALSFERIQQIEMEHGRVNPYSPAFYWLNISDTDGGQMKWPIHPSYGIPVTTAENIIGAFQRYQRQVVKQSQKS